MQILIGCAGWSIPRAYSALFGDGESVLARYATRFAAVEINSSFYRPHRQTTYLRWAKATPAHFRFSVKMPKEMSHERALRNCGSVLDRFLDEVSGLETKLGGFLLQLPPSLPFDTRVASTFFRMVRRRSAAPLVCEPRHASWFTRAADALFQRQGVTRVSADPVIPVTEAPSRSLPRLYWRLHGAPRMYYSDYSEEALRDIAHEVAVSHVAKTVPWVIFDNTAHGFAIPNAARLQELMQPVLPLGIGGRASA